MYVDPSRLAGLPGLRAYYNYPGDDLQVEAWRENHVRDLRGQQDLWAHVEVRSTELSDGEGLEITLYAVSQEALQYYLDSDRTEIRRQAKENGLVYGAVFGMVDEGFGITQSGGGVEDEGRFGGGFEGRAF